MSTPVDQHVAVRLEDNHYETVMLRSLHFSSSDQLDQHKPYVTKSITNITSFRSRNNSY